MHGGPSMGKAVSRIALYALVALSIITPIRLWVAQPFVISGNSMIPAFQPGDYLVVDELSYRSAAPQRGDVIIFEYPLDPELVFIKRIVGLPGEGVHIRDGVVSIMGTNSTTTHILIEPYRATAVVQKEKFDVLLHDDEYYVLGDNRDGSSDSRVWGPLTKKFIVGRVAMRMLPLSRATIFSCDISVY